MLEKPNYTFLYRRDTLALRTPCPKVSLSLGEIMSDFPNHKPTDDLFVKINRPNRLAGFVEKRAAAGVALPKKLAHHHRKLQQLTQLSKNALQGTFPAEVLNECQVVSASNVMMTLSFGSPTAVNHARYMIENCVQALRAYDSRFGQLQTIKVILSPQPSKPASQPRLIKKTLSENTKATITHSAKFVTNNERLRQALLQLSQS